MEAEQNNDWHHDMLEMTSGLAGMWAWSLGKDWAVPLNEARSQKGQKRRSQGK